MKTKYQSYVCPLWLPFSAVCRAAPLLLFAVLASSAQTNTYLFSGSKTNITLNPGLYQITVYGGQGAYGGFYTDSVGGLGAEMRAEFSFSGLTTLTLLVGGAGGHSPFDSSAGGGG